MNDQYLRLALVIDLAVKRSPPEPLTPAALFGLFACPIVKPPLELGGALNKLLLLLGKALLLA